MNKQEAIEKINYIDSMNIKDKISCQQVDMVIKNQVLDIIDQIDEPQKPVVPQFVADWYEEHKDNFEYSVQCLCVQGCKPVRQIDIWFDNDDNKPIVTLVKMKLFGYEVEKEKLYEVFLKRTGAQLGVCVPHGEDKTQFTKVELQEYDFDNLDAFEVEEVDE